MKLYKLPAITFLLMCLVTPVVAQEEAPPAASPGATDVGAGKRVYEKRCVHCHGIKGRGDGVAADRFVPAPTNFAAGKFKYASTAKDELPTDDDLFKTISNGLPGTGMPAWGEILSEQERRQVVSYVKTFSKKFAKQTGAPKMIALGDKIASSKESIEKGKALFFEMECNRCHGNEGRADGKNASELKVWPRNFTKGWTFRRTNAPEEIFQRITRGIIVMPSFAEGENVETTPQQRWHIANYVHSLSQFEGAPDWKTAIMAKPVDGDVAADPTDPRWSDLARHDFQLFGQVTRDPRLFTPTVDMVTVKAMYNSKDVSLLVVWDDPRESAETGAAHSDAVAVQFPIKLSGGEEKPYFIMGNDKESVYLMHWSGDGGMAEVNAAGQDNVTPQAKQHLTGKAVYKDGQYRAVFKRALRTNDPQHDLQFAVGQFIPIAFTAWDGDHGEHGGLRALSSWYHLYLEEPPPMDRFLYPTLFAGAVVFVQWRIIRSYREKGKAKNNGEG